MGARSSSMKIKVTTSLDANLVKAIDNFLETSRSRSRSQLIEDILMNWYKENKKQEIERQIEKYYLSMSDEEREEDQQWCEIASQSYRHLWED